MKRVRLKYLIWISWASLVILQLYYYFYIKTIKSKWMEICYAIKMCKTFLIGPKKPFFFSVAVQLWWFGSGKRKALCQIYSDFKTWTFWTLNRTERSKETDGGRFTWAENRWGHTLTVCCCSHWPETWEKVISEPSSVSGPSSDRCYTNKASDRLHPAPLWLPVQPVRWALTHSCSLSQLYSVLM